MQENFPPQFEERGTYFHGFLEMKFRVYMRNFTLYAAEFFFEKYTFESEKFLFRLLKGHEESCQQLPWLLHYQVLSSPPQNTSKFFRTSHTRSTQYREDSI